MEKFKSPYSAIIHLTIDIHPTLATGEIDGKILSKSEMLNRGIHKTQLVRVDGYNLNDCIKKLINKLKEFKTS